MVAAVFVDNSVGCRTPPVVIETLQGFSKFFRSHYSDNAANWTARGSNSGRGRFPLFSEASMLAVGPTQPPVRWVFWFFRV